MPTHVTQSTGASVTATWEFTTGTLAVSVPATFKTNTIAETSAGSGVTIDGVIVKDGGITLSTGTSLPLSMGGTGATTAAAALVSLGVGGGYAAAGANADITSLTALTTPITIAQGGTGTTKITEYLAVICVAPSTSLSAVSDVAHILMPFSGYFESAFAGVSTAATGTSVVVNCHKNAVSIFTTRLGIDINETTSATATVPNVITTATSTFNQWDKLAIHVDNPGGTGTTVAKGLVVEFICKRG